MMPIDPKALAAEALPCSCTARYDNLPFHNVDCPVEKRPAVEAAIMKALDAQHEQLRLATIDQANTEGELNDLRAAVREHAAIVVEALRRVVGVGDYQPTRVMAQRALEFFEGMLLGE